MRLSYTQTNEIDYIPKLFRSRKSLIKMADIINTSSPPQKPQQPPLKFVLFQNLYLKPDRWFIHIPFLSYVVKKIVNQFKENQNNVTVPSFLSGAN